MGNFCYYTCDTTPRGQQLITAMIQQARVAGVTEDFHVFANKPVDLPGVINYSVGPIDIKYHTFKWRLLRDFLADLNYDYFVWLDSDTWFTRNPGDLEAQLLRGNKMWCQLESEITSPDNKKPHWWDVPNRALIKLFRDHGAGDTVWSSNGGMFIVRREAVREVVHELEQFHQLCLSAGYKNVHDEFCLAWLGQVKPFVLDPEKNTSVETCEIWSCDWMGTFDGRLPTSDPWESVDWLTGARRTVTPAIIHAMRSKDAMAYGEVAFKPIVRPVPPEVVKPVRTAVNSDKYLILCVRSESDGSIFCDFYQYGFPTAGMETAQKLIQGELTKEVQRRAKLEKSEATQAGPKGPGSHLSDILKSLGFPPCQLCKDMAAKMDEWGVDGCKLPENRETILKRLRDQAAAAGWWEANRARALAVSTGIAFKLNWLDPAPSLLDLAIERASAK